MKRTKIFRTLLCLLFAALLFCFCAAAAAESDAANALYAMGLISGYDNGGFGLTDPLTRGQAVVLLERFLGVGETAAAFDPTTPFADVPDWAAPYVAYAYSTGLVKGVSAARFGTDDPIRETDFTTLLLRAMDYHEENGDFTYGAHFPLANRLGLTENTAPADAFVRGDAFLLCARALEAPKKGGETVAASLCAAGVITERAYGFAKRIAKGETITVACVGDSITQGTGSSNASKYSYPAVLQKLLGPGFAVVNCGKASAYVMDPKSAYNVKSGSPDLWYPSTAAYGKLKSADPDVVIVLLGVNDSRSMVKREAEPVFTESYTSLVENIAALPSSPEIFLSTPLPAISTERGYQSTVYSLPRLIRKVGEETGCPVIETGEALHDYYCVMLAYNDGLHPTDVSYPALAAHFADTVFGQKQAIPELPVAAGDTVYVAGFGSRQYDGASPETPVDSLPLAVAMLRKTGGRVVVCGSTSVKATHLVGAAAPVTVTGKDGTTDYGSKATLRVGGNITLGSETAFEHLTLHITANDKSINGGFHSLTLGEGLTCVSDSGMSPLKVILGHRLENACITDEDVSCTENCRLTVESGTWQLLRGGNMRAAAYVPAGTVKAGVTVQIRVTGGEFTVGRDSTAASTFASGSGCAGTYTVELLGGRFDGNLYGIASVSAPTYVPKPTYTGDLLVTLGKTEIGGKFGLYQSGSSPRAEGESVLTCTDGASDPGGSGFARVVNGQ